MRLNEKAKWIIDGISILFILTLTLIVADACRINIHESPVDGVPQGSSYTASAIGNPDWVSEYPRLAKAISSSQILEALDGMLMIPSVLILITFIYPMPVLCFAWLACRVWTKRKNLLYSIPVTLLLGWLVFITAFIQSAVGVMMD